VRVGGKVVLAERSAVCLVAGRALLFWPVLGLGGWGGSSCSLSVTHYIVVRSFWRVRYALGNEAATRRQPY